MPPAVRIFTAPDASCGGAAWSDAAKMVGARPQRRFGDALEVEQVPLLGPRSFELPEVIEAISRGGRDARG